MYCDARTGVQASGYKAVTHHQIEALSFLADAAGNGAQSDGSLSGVRKPRAWASAGRAWIVFFAANQSGQLVSPLEGKAVLLEVKTHAQISPRRGHSFRCVPGCG